VQVKTLVAAVCAIVIAMLGTVAFVLYREFVVEPNRTVDQAPYVRENERVLRTIPVFRGEPLWNSYSNALASNPTGPFENGGPFDLWRTTHEFKLPANVDCQTIGRYYRRLLTRRGWTPRAYTSGLAFATYLKGASFLVVTCSPDGKWGGRWSLGVDYSSPHYR
jgi:hypothetical protein